jgi:hypothetical protein
MYNTKISNANRGVTMPRPATKMMKALSPIAGRIYVQPGPAVCSVTDKATVPSKPVDRDGNACTQDRAHGGG